MKCLRSRRLIVCVVEANEGVAQERGELPARFFQLRTGHGGGFQQLGEIRTHFRVGVVVVVDARRPLVTFALGEDRAGHFELAGLGSREGDVLFGMFAAGLLGQAIAEGHQGIERDQSLVIQNRANSGGYLMVHLLAVR